MGFLRRCSLVCPVLCTCGERDRVGCLFLLRLHKIFSWPLLGNLDLLPPSGKSAKPGAAPTEHKGLVPHNGSLINVGSLLQRAEQQDSGRLYLENKIHTLELKLGEWSRGCGACRGWDGRVGIPRD